MKILSWNLLHGGGTRITHIIDFLKSQNADVISLQEFRHGKSLTPLLRGLEVSGFEYHYYPPTKNARQNGLAVFSRYPLENEHIVFANADGGHHAIQVTVVTPEQDKLDVLNVHFPHKKAQIPVFESLASLTDEALITNSLIIGDLNCGIPFEDSETRSFQYTHLFQGLLKKGWIDTWRSRNPTLREYTWFSTNKNNGFRYDHALASPALNQHIESVQYLHAPRMEKLSDHSCLEVTLRDPT